MGRSARRVSVVNSREVHEPEGRCGLADEGASRVRVRAKLSHRPRGRVARLKPGFCFLLRLTRRWRVVLRGQPGLRPRGRGGFKDLVNVPAILRFPNL
jgi:hypothetical protein